MEQIIKADLDDNGPLGFNAEGYMRNAMNQLDYAKHMAKVVKA